MSRFDPDINSARGIAQRWAFWAQPFCQAGSDGECSASDCAGNLPGGATCPRVWLRNFDELNEPPARLEDNERDALLALVRTTMANEVERVRQGMLRIESRGFVSGDCTVEPEPEWLSRVIANVLSLGAASALALCEAAGWPEAHDRVSEVLS